MFMNAHGKPTCLYVDDETKTFLDDYGEEYKISRSAALRIIVKNFFVNKRDTDETQ